MVEHPPGTVGQGGADRSVRLSVPETLGEEAGAVLMDVLGSFEEERQGHYPQEVQEGQEGRVTLVFYPPVDGPFTREELLPLLPAAFAASGVLQMETKDVSRDWVEGWREHFRPIVVEAVRIRPPWEPPLAPTPPDAAGATASASAFRRAPSAAEAKPPLVDVVINPGLGFGTGLHPTTRGTLLLLQAGMRDSTGHADDHTAGSAVVRGPLVDVGTGSGILAIAAAKLGWAPVVALDDDPVALVSTRENVAMNGVQSEVEVHEVDAVDADERWFHDATVLANMTLEPVSLLVRRLAGEAARPRRLVVSGVLAGSQEEQLMLIAHESRFTAGSRLYEEEWVSLELFPDRPEG
jgi:ribosomal protein L11 methyltransferase